MGVTNNNTTSLFDRRYTRRIQICCKCKKEFKHGDEIYNKRGTTRKAYHLKCWESTLN